MENLKHTPSKCLKNIYRQWIPWEKKTLYKKYSFFSADYGERSGYAYVLENRLYFGCFHIQALTRSGILQDIKKLCSPINQKLILMSAQDSYGNFLIVRALGIKKGYLLGRLEEKIPNRDIEMWFFDQLASRKNADNIRLWVKGHIYNEDVKVPYHMCEHTSDALEIFSNAFVLTKKKVSSFKIYGKKKK